MWTINFRYWMVVWWLQPNRYVIANAENRSKLCRPFFCIPFHVRLIFIRNQWFFSSFHVFVFLKLNIFYYYLCILCIHLLSILLSSLSQINKIVNNRMSLLILKKVSIYNSLQCLYHHRHRLERETKGQMRKQWIDEHWVNRLPIEQSILYFYN